MTHTDQSLQERYYPDLPCFGCGPANDKGLRLRSFATTDGLVTASFTPWPEHDNGLGFLNGGIIATVLDCHSAAAVTHEAFTRGWPPLPGAALPYVTASLDVELSPSGPAQRDGGPPGRGGGRQRVGDDGPRVARVGREGARRGHGRVEEVASALTRRARRPSTNDFTTSLVST